jgi:nickel transport protein
LLAVLALLALTGSAHAHRLQADYRVLPGRTVQVEGWFDLTRDSPKGAEVRVLRADGTLLTEGRLDDEGVFAFTFDRAEPLKVVVSAGQGHRKELSISAEELAKGGGTEVTPAAAAPPAAPHPFADRSPAVSIKDVLIGVAFLLALGAFVLSVRNARQLRRLRLGSAVQAALPDRDTANGDRHRVTGVPPVQRRS